MAKKDIFIPDLGTDAVDVIDILVSPGDVVEEEQGLVSVEGDKASMDIPAPFAGTIVSITVKTGDRVSSGMKLGEMEVGEGEAGATDNQSEKTSEPADPAPNDGAQAPLVESKPAVAPAPASSAGLVPGANVKQNLNVYASPSVRKIANRFGVDLTRVHGSGRKGRILAEDVEAWVKQTLANMGTTRSGTGFNLPEMPKVDFARYGDIETVELSKIQKFSGPALHRNWVSIPHVTQFEESDISEMENFRKSQNNPAEVKARGFKLTPLVFIMKAVAKTLELHPKMNTSLSPDGQSLIYKKYIHIGIAVDTPNGLVVPVIRDVNKRTISDLSKELFETSQKARDGQLTIESMKGGCFSISSLGGIGGINFTPIVNAPEVGILGVSRAQKKPIWNGESFEPRLMLPLALSYDHRVIDGADAARFITTLKSELEDIRKIIM